METWKNIDGFPGYQVSDFGRVRSRMISPAWKILKSRDYSGYGHQAVGLYPFPNSLPKTRKVHALVLESFIGKCPDGMECRHLNGKPWDNNLENLKWGTKLENRADMEGHGTAPRGEKNGFSILTTEQVVKIRNRKAAGEKRELLADNYGVSVSTIKAVCSGQNWQHVLRTPQPTRRERGDAYRQKVFDHYCKTKSMTETESHFGISHSYMYAILAKARP